MFEVIRRNRLSHPIRDLMESLTSDPFFSGNGNGTTWIEEGNLALDISEKDGEVIVRASVPGYRREDIDVQIHEGVLSIKAEKIQETESKNERFYYKERRTGAVSRRVALPGMLADAKAKAELKDGVLTLRIPQSEAAKPKQIQIN